MSDEEVTKPDAVASEVTKPISPSYEDALKAIFGNVWDTKMRDFNIQVERVVQAAEELNATHKAILAQHKDCVSREEFGHWKRSIEDRVGDLERASGEPEQQ